MILIYKIVPKTMWDSARRTGTFTGAPIDLADGFIHFSAGHQVAETVTRHFAGQEELLVAVEADDLGDALKWEVSRGGDEFPHLYTSLAPEIAEWVAPLPLRPKGHEFPKGVLV